MEQFHHRGYVSTDPRILPAEGVGLDRPADVPEELDVLIVGTGPAGMIAAAQLSRFPAIRTRIVERMEHRLEIGRADGIQTRSVETFDAFDFAEEITAEAFKLTAMNFWGPDPEDPGRIVHNGWAPDDDRGISEYVQLIVNQTRVYDYFERYMRWSPSRSTPDYGYEFVAVEEHEGEELPLLVTLRRTAGPDAGRERRVRTKYLIGADGARSAVRRAIGRRLVGEPQNQAWGVLDLLAVTDFPDIRTKSAIANRHGSILVIPREGGHLFRLYVDMGEVPPGGSDRIRAMTAEDVIAVAKRILNPYSLKVKEVVWSTIYEVNHRVADGFDNGSERKPPNVFIVGDACHTHSAKAGQGMNVSMQDGFNLAWKIAYALSGLAAPELLRTYELERRVAAVNLIEFDKALSSRYAHAEEEGTEKELEEFYLRTIEFAAGHSTEYQESLITEGPEHQRLATGFPLGKRFKSARVMRRADAYDLHLGHTHEADGCFRVYVFADRDGLAADSPLRRWADWVLRSPESPANRYPLRDGTRDSAFDIKVVYQQALSEFAFDDAHPLFKPETGPYRLRDYSKVFAVLPEEDVFDLRGIDRDGAVVVVRPDQYVSAVLPLADPEALGRYFDRFMAG
ncbi:FAD-dependent monooxygenase [Gulosibacter sp. 10]|uniref:FAD-dependent monooxygenase n=1 Tax=Gulosibacter sp. 10 TaxID=1255570 RepID=UPI00097EBD4C|nr:FAD-dependent monooxygenase [Gulosibacter sp. 10]SJM71352.1 Salicylate hydroxylase [Gulosibacter sp. 10]